jgi:Zn-dependent protease
MFYVSGQFDLLQNSGYHIIKFLARQHMLSVITLVTFEVIILIMSVVIHEVAHGVAAFWQGDLTAKYAGRLTLNPFKHLDLYGSFIVPLIMIWTVGISFGWAKPVPYNPYNLRNQKTGPALVGIAGPISNIIIAIIFGLAARFLAVNYMSKVDIVTNLFNMNFENLVISVSGSFSAIFFLIFSMIALINILLAFFNLIPIPPLDGSKLLFAILPISTRTQIVMEQMGFVFLLLFIFVFSNFLGVFLSFVRSAFFYYIVGV